MKAVVIGGKLQGVEAAYLAKKAGWEVVLIDKSELHIREYLSIENKRLQRLTYRFHWQSQERQLLARWDNAPHHPQIKTHPYHKHTPAIIVESEELSIIQLILEIIKEIKIV